jgi:hypothetical protein
VQFGYHTNNRFTIWRFILSGETRIRRRVIPVDPKINGGGPWNSVISLGGFRAKGVVRDGTSYPEEWQPSFYQTAEYAPSVSACSAEVTVDELHGKYPYRTGGPFLHVKVTTAQPISGRVLDGVRYNVSGTKRYEGGFAPPDLAYWGGGWASAPLAYYSTSNALIPDVAPYFDRAWRSAKPKLELAGLFQFLAEAEDVPRTLLTTADGFSRIWKRMGGEVGPPIMQPKHIADQFVNEQFGWAPFLRDLQSFKSLYDTAQREMERIRSENGRWVKKRVKVFKDETVETILEQEAVGVDSYALPIFPFGFPTDFFLRRPSWRVYETTTHSIAASGKFRFYRPEFDDSGGQNYDSAWNKAMRWITISGLRPTPSNIYKIIPWSWLADWVSSLGTQIQAISDSAIDSVAAAYFYITSHLTKIRTFEIDLPFVAGFQRLKFETKFECKQRVSADSPYGFNLTWDQLSPKQLAILGALGISRKT